MLYPQYAEPCQASLVKTRRVAEVTSPAVGVYTPFSDRADHHGSGTVQLASAHASPRRALGCSSVKGGVPSLSWPHHQIQLFPRRSDRTRHHPAAVGSGTGLLWVNPQEPTFLRCITVRRATPDPLQDSFLPLSVELTR